MCTTSNILWLQLFLITTYFLINVESRFHLRERPHAFTFQDSDFPNITIPPHVFFGAATAGFQIEGGWNADGKGMSDLDIMYNIQLLSADKKTAMVAADSYHKYKEDVACLKTVGLEMYRFSIQWPRILPNGTIENINPQGIQYYMNLIDELLINGIEPMVTIFHWEMPDVLELKGGWLYENIVQVFTDYAELLFTVFGEKVKWWITINEPLEISRGYRGKGSLPRNISPSYGQFKAGYNIMKAHASAVHLYRKKFGWQKGKISISLGGMFGVPMSDSPEDVAAAERYNQFSVGWFGHPIFSKEGNYPQLMMDVLDHSFGIWGIRNSILLPRFTKEEVEYIRGTADYIAINHYLGTLMTPLIPSLKNPRIPRKGGVPFVIGEANVVVHFGDDWPKTAAPWIRVYPEGFGKMLRWLKGQFGHLPIVVTENGCASEDVIQDDIKILYFKEHLKQLAHAINVDRVNIIGYTVWSIIDTFEWFSGYAYRFGLYGINFTHPERPRIMRKSAYYMQQMFKRIRGKRCKH